MAPTMTASGAVLVKAGTNHSTDFDTGWTVGSEYDKWIEEAESFLCDLVKYDLVGNWASLNAVYKLIFQEYCARSAAIEAITYDMSGYTSRQEGEDLINVHLFRMDKIIEILKEAAVQDFMGV